MRANEFAVDARHITWYEIEPKGYETVKVVDGQVMDKEQYDVCDYRLEGTYTSSNGREVPIWRASLEGLRRYGRLKVEREEREFRQRQTRRVAEDEYSQSMQQLIEEREQ